MKVILLQDVAKLGHRYDVVTVPDGYGMNKLVPQGMAKPATPENLKAIEAQKAKGAANAAANSAAFADLAKMLEGKVVDVAADANEDGKLYQALKAEDIVAAVAAELSLTLTPAQIVIGEPIKQTGEQTIEAANGTDTTSFTINVIAK